MTRRRWLERLFGARPAPGRARWARLGVEMLEDRTAPATFTVVNTADAGTGSLRQAILDANNEAVNPGPDTIVFAASLAGQTIGLTTVGDTSFGPSALGITSTITIQGLTSGGGITISRGAGAPAMRLFTVATGGSLTLNDLTLTGGRAIGAPGTPITAPTLGEGGAIFNAGQLALQQSTLSGNTAVGGDAGTFSGGFGSLGLGGAVFNYSGKVTILDSTLSGNTARGGVGSTGFGGTGAGGAVCNGITSDPTLIVTNSTLSGNTAQGGAGLTSSGGRGAGGGVYNGFTATAILSNSTLSGNTALSGAGQAAGGTGTGGGLYGNVANLSTALTIGNTIVAGNTASSSSPDLSGPVTSQGSNLIGNPSGATGLVASDLQNVNPLLGPLQNNGGPTPTQALLAGSPASNAGNNALAAGNGLVVDQRGFLRVVGPRVDIGAFEFQPAATTVAVSTSGTPSLAGNAVTFKATVTPTAPGPNNTPTGTVFFSSNGAPLGSASLVNGVATFSTTALPAGNDAIVATYGGDFNFTANSGGLFQTVQGQTTTTLASSANPAVFGQAITFTATVSPVAPAACPPSGTVSFSSDGAALGSVGLVNGVATLSTAALAVGSHAIAVSYAGDGIFLSSSAGLTQQVNQGATTTALGSSANPSTFGQPVTFTATVNPVAPAAGSPSGMVTFSSDGALLGSASLVNGVATLSTAALAAGSHAIVATYSGDGNFLASSVSLGQQVNQGPTQTSLSAAPNPALNRQGSAFTATVRPAGPFVPSTLPGGSVTFSSDGTPLGSAPLVKGSATLTAALPIGSHSVVATYSGDTNFLPSSASLVQGVVGVPDTASIFDTNTATWFLHDVSAAGAPSIPPFSFGVPGWRAVVGDWTHSGTTGIGVFDPGTATWYLRASNSAGAPDFVFQFGAPGWVPVVGDWNGDGQTDIGAFDPASATWYLKFGIGAGAPDAGVFQFGGVGWLPVVGDWNGDGQADIGVFDPTTATWYLKFGIGAGAPDAGVFQFGGAGWRPVVGDWNGDGISTVGVFDPASATWYLRNSNSAGGADAGVFQYGGTNGSAAVSFGNLGASTLAWQPLATRLVLPNLGQPRSAAGSSPDNPLAAGMDGASAALAPARR
jgi:hypothetical protein